EHTFSQHAGSPSPDTVALSEGLAKLQQKLFTETELFCRRLQVFLEISETAPASPEPNTVEQGGG
ncbi:MAG TPA: hypothetical protein VGX03_23265, partial [Candidatus Binatia bacterium]|nr:hypothetical protein [Candidatus Binatia bacterium]